MRISAWNNGDIRGWFDLVSAGSAEANPPTCRTFPKKRLKGFEPTTFCMAITPAIWRVRRHKPVICRRFSGGMIGARRRQYAWMCADMRRFGHF
jgi:hypothetical protein